MITYPYIYQDWSEFKLSRVGSVLSDAISAVVTEERNGLFDLELQYPYDGENADQIVIGAIISAKPSPTESSAPFRIYDIQRDINGVMTVQAHHIVYDANGIIVPAFSANTTAGIISALNTHLNNQNMDFVCYMSGVFSANLEYASPVPASLWSLIGHVASALEAELSYQYDAVNSRLVIRFNRHRGTSSLATIAYGVNLLSMQGGQNGEGVYTDVYPYYYDEDSDTYVELPEKTINTGATSYTRILMIDMTGEFDTVPAVSDLRTAANKLVSEMNFSIKNSTAFDFVPIANTTEYAGTAAAQEINLCDTVTVRAQNIGISVTAKVVKTVFNVLLNKYNALTVGSIVPTIADTIAGLERREGSSAGTSYPLYDGGVI